jgi:tetratricopeptide (TPR) repeat protein
LARLLGRSESVPAMREAVTDLIEDPADEDRVAALRWQIRKVLSADPEMAAEIRRMLAGEDVEGLLGQLDSGHVLITTRRDIGWDRLVDTCLRLDMLDREPAVQMLVGGEDDPDLLSAAVLADQLGYLPLALQQAASYIRQTRTPVASYLERLRAQPERVLALIAEGDRAERAVAQVWLETLSRLRADRPAAIEMLRLLSCFAPDDVPRSLLVDDSADVVELEQALAVLASYSLITLTGATVGMHRLLQTVVREQARREDPPSDDAAAPRTWTQTLNRAVSALTDAAPEENLSDAVHTWPQWTLLAPHIDALAEHIQGESANLDFADLAGQLAFFHSTQARYEAAEELDRRVLAISEAALPDGHADIATRLDNLASTLGALGRPVEALPLQERAASIRESAGRSANP